MKKYYVLMSTLLALMAQTSYANDADLAKKIEKLSQEIEQLKAKTSAPEASIKGDMFAVYGSIRPTLEYIQEDNEQDGDSYFDQNDALSHVGFKGDYKVNDSFSAFFKSEWSIQLNDGGELGKSRQIFAGLKTPVGTVAIGKQRPAQYLFIAEYIDIFNHRSSPFAYDYRGAFFVDNMVTYQNTFENISIHSGIQFNGRSGSNNADFANVGIAYDKEDFHATVTYVDKTNAAENGLLEGASVKMYSVGAANSFGDFYVAFGYEGIKTELLGTETDSSTLDIVAAYKLPNNFKLKAGYFAIDDDIKYNELTGYNITLENQLSDNVRVHFEYLTRDFEQQEDFSSLAIGIRYDFTLGF